MTNDFPLNTTNANKFSFQPFITGHHSVEEDARRSMAKIKASERKLVHKLRPGAAGTIITVGSASAMTITTGLSAFGVLASVVVGIAASIGLEVDYRKKNNVSKHILLSGYPFVITSNTELALKGYISKVMREPHKDTGKLFEDTQGHTYVFRFNNGVFIINAYDEGFKNRVLSSTVRPALENNSKKRTSMLLLSEVKEKVEKIFDDKQKKTYDKIVHKMSRLNSLNLNADDNFVVERVEKDVLNILELHAAALFLESENYDKGRLDNLLSHLLEELQDIIDKQVNEINGELDVYESIVLGRRSK
jgi:hypothetical protein